jgi:hypothetical protein
LALSSFSQSCWGAEAAADQDPNQGGGCCAARHCASIAEKIEEVAQTGSFRRLEEVRSDPVHRITELFRGIYGVGAAQASAWVSAGYETIEQLVELADLTTNQKIGIEHYDDFQTRIPLEGVTHHGLIVGRALEHVDPGLKFVIGGSYRRGSPDTGDIDVMITKLDADSSYLQSVIMDTVVPQLKKDGFIVAELANRDDKNSSKWDEGICIARYDDLASIGSTVRALERERRGPFVLDWQRHIQPQPPPPRKQKRHASEPARAVQRRYERPGSSQDH